MPIGKGTTVVRNLNVEVCDEKLEELGAARRSTRPRDVLSFALLSVGLGPIRVGTVAAESLGPLRLHPVFVDEAMLVMPIASRRQQLFQSTGDMRINV